MSVKLSEWKLAAFDTRFECFSDDNILISSAIFVFKSDAHGEEILASGGSISHHHGGTNYNRLELNFDQICSV